LRRLRRLEAVNLIRCYQRPNGTVIYVRWRPLGREILNLEMETDELKFSTPAQGEFFTGPHESADVNEEVGCYALQG